MRTFYRCSKNESHQFSAPDGVTLTKCLTFVGGKPCPGVLKRLGAGTEEQKEYCKGSAHFAPIKGKLKGECPVCNKEVTILSSGRFRKHV